MAGSVTSFMLAALQVYFLLMNFTVERYYCNSSGVFTENDDRFLVKETMAFCKDHNPLFLAHPEWMVSATCISAYVFPIGYILILLASLFDLWRPFAIPLCLFIGAKIYGIFFYHWMEFTHPTLSPPNLVPYFSVEGPYILSMAVVMMKVISALYQTKKEKKG